MAETHSFDQILTPKLRNRAVAAVRAQLAPALEPLGDTAGLQDLIDGFWSLYEERPVAENKGGSGFNDSLSIYLIARILNPSAIIESGTWKGQSAWFFRQACPHARIVTFDPEPHPERVELADVEYRASDWSEAALDDIDPARSLVFFDDHVSQARRLREAAAGGFRHLLFDDNFAAQHLHKTGMPPLPTLRLLYDDGIASGETLEWVRHGRPRRFTLDGADRAVLDEVARYTEFPDLALATGYPPQSGLSYVQLT